MSKLSDIERIVRKLIEQEVILEAAAEEIKQSIPKRTRLGNGVKENMGPTHKLPPLKETTVKIRKQLKKSGRLTGPGATPKRSGFNRTGDTLENLQVEVKPKEINVSLGPDGQDKLRDALNINKDYQFMRLSKAEYRKVLRSITNKIESILSKVRFTKL